jgi:hypothetical protein
MSRIERVKRDLAATFTCFILTLTLTPLDVDSFNFVNINKLPLNNHNSTNRPFKFEPKFTHKDLHTIENFLFTLKNQLAGNWSRNGLQRIVRLKSACSQRFVLMRSPMTTMTRHQKQVTADFGADYQKYEYPYSERCNLYFYLERQPVLNENVFFF